MMAACDSIRNDLKAFQDRELPLSARIRVRLHLARCASCREEIRSMSRISNALRSSGSAELEGKLRSKLVGLIPADAREAAARGSRKRPLMIAWGVASVAALGWFAFQMQPRIMGDSQGSEAFASKAAGGPQVAAAPSMMAGRAMAGAPQGGMGGFAGEQPQMFRQMKAMASPGMAPGGESKSVVSHIDSDRVSDFTERIAKAKVPAAARSVPPGQTRMAGDQVIPKDTTLLTEPGSSAAATVTAAQRDIHREGDISVEVAKVEESSSSVEQWTRETSGGYVASNELNTGDDGVKTATLLIKVPVNEFEGIMKKIAGLGNVTAKHVSGEDLTERISDTGQEKKSLQEQIDEEASQIGKIKNHWERQDARDQLRDLKVRQAQAQGRLEMLKKMATLSSISVDLHEKSKVAAPKASGGLMDDMSDALHSAGQSVIAMAKVPLTLLIWIIAYSPLWVLLALGYRYIIRS